MPTSLKSASNLQQDEPMPRHVRFAISMPPLGRDLQHTAKSHLWRVARIGGPRSPLFLKLSPPARTCRASAQGEAMGPAPAPTNHTTALSTVHLTVPDSAQNVRKLSSNTLSTNLLVSSARRVLCFRLKHMRTRPSHSCARGTKSGHPRPAHAPQRAPPHLEIYRRWRVARFNTHNTGLHLRRRPEIILPHLRTTCHQARATHDRGPAFINWSTFASNCVFTDSRQYNSSPGLRPARTCGRRTGSRACALRAQPQREFFLKHDNSTPEHRSVPQQPECNARRDIVRNICHTYVKVGQLNLELHDSG